MQELQNWLPSVIFILFVGTAYFSRNAIKIWMERGIQSSFEVKLEKFRSDLRANQEALAALRQGALMGALRRRESLDKRRLEAIDRLWEATVDLGKLKYISKIMESVNFEESAKLAPSDENVRRLFETIGKPFTLEKLPTIKAATERLYVSDKAWALFNAYQAILYYGLLQIKLLEFGVGGAPKLLNEKHITDLIAASLPHQVSFIEQYGTSSCHYLVEELQESVFRELKRNLDDNHTAEQDISDAAKILAASNVAMDQLAVELTSN